MVKITPNCFQCKMLGKVIQSSGCGTVVHFKCIVKDIRIYGNPELIICNRWEEEGK